DDSSINVLSRREAPSYSPTAAQLSADTHPTPLRLLCSVLAVFALPATLQPADVCCRARVWLMKLGGAVRAPTATQSESETHATALSTSFSPVAVLGLLTLVQPEEVRCRVSVR